MTSAASGPTNTAISRGASRHTAPPMARQNTTTQNTAHRVPLRMRSRFWAPKFWATKVEKACRSPGRACRPGCRSSPPRRRRPSPWCRSCSPAPGTRRMPKFITDCCRQVKPDRLSSSQGGPAPVAVLPPHPQGGEGFPGVQGQAHPPPGTGRAPWPGPPPGPPWPGGPRRAGPGRCSAPRKSPERAGGWRSCPPERREVGEEVIEEGGEDPPKTQRR